MTAAGYRAPRRSTATATPPGTTRVVGSPAVQSAPRRQVGLEQSSDLLMCCAAADSREDGMICLDHGFEQNERSSIERRRLALVVAFAHEPGEVREQDRKVGVGLARGAAP
jgi:hypothetical protein